MRLILLALLAAGCSPPLLELRNTADRIWMQTPDRKTVYRCFDMTPAGTPYRGGLKVFCKEVELYDTRWSGPLVEVSEPAK